MKSIRSNEPIDHLHGRVYKDRTLEVQIYMDRKENNRSFLSARGLPFIMEIIHELVRDNSTTYAELKEKLGKLLDGYGAKFTSGLLDLIIGDNPEVHSFHVDAGGVICLHPAPR